MKIYIVQISGGNYEDSYTIIDKAFLSEEIAKEYVETRNDSLRYRDMYYAYIDDILYDDLFEIDNDQILWGEDELDRIGFYSIEETDLEVNGLNNIVKAYTKSLTNKSIKHYENLLLDNSRDM